MSFHQEILSFLKVSATSQEKEQGFDLAFDVKLQSLHRSLDSAICENGPFSLEEILENYQHLFVERGPLHTELQWIRSFSPKEFEGLGLSAYFPRIYRGLPRLYHRDHCHQSLIKKNFTNLGNLKELSIDKAIFSLYDQTPLPEMRLSILTWVIPDGFGDYIAAIETAKILHAKFAHLQIELFFITSRELPRVAEFPTTIISDDKENWQRPFSSEILNKFRGSDLILQIPTYFPHSEDLFRAVQSISSDRPMPVIEHIGEYGFLESDWFHPKTKNRSLGLHALEKGIFIRKTHPCSFSEIEQKTLLEWMFGTSAPGPAEIETYLDQRRFHLAYLATPVGGAIYLHSLLKMYEWEEKDIDICSPDLSWLIQWIQSRKEESSLVLEGDFGVREIEIVTPQGHHRIILKEKGKKIRILNPGILSSADMRRLYFLSEEWVAVRGDQSFSEAVSSGKSFFYDGKDHKRYFLKDLLAIAENKLAGHRSAQIAFRMIGHASLWNMQEEKAQWVDELYFQSKEKMDWTGIANVLGRALQDPDTIAGFKKFCLHLAEEYSVAPFLTHLVQRQACHTAHPDLRELEARLISLYLNRGLPFSSLVKNLRIAILQKKGGVLGPDRSRETLLSESF